IAVLEGGRVVAFGDTTEILSVPPTAFVADLAGLNRLQGTIQSIDAKGHAILDSHNQDIHGDLELSPTLSTNDLAPSALGTTGQAATAVVSPYDVQLHLDPLRAGSGLTTIRGTSHSATADSLSQQRDSSRDDQK